MCYVSAVAVPKLPEALCQRQVSWEYPAESFACKVSKNETPRSTVPGSYVRRPEAVIDVLVDFDQLTGFETSTQSRLHSVPPLTTFRAFLYSLYPFEPDYLLYTYVLTN